MLIKLQPGGQRKEPAEEEGGNINCSPVMLKHYVCSLLCAGVKGQTANQVARLHVAADAAFCWRGVELIRSASKAGDD